MATAAGAMSVSWLWNSRGKLPGGRLRPPGPDRKAGPCWTVAMPHREETAMQNPPEPLLPAAIVAASLLLTVSSSNLDAQGLTL